MWHDLCAENPAKIFVDREKKQDSCQCVYYAIIYAKRRNVLLIFMC